MPAYSESDRPVVSVILPIYNAERWLDETIGSVFGQTFSKWELLLVNDGSTDHSPEIAKQFAIDFPSRVRYLEHPGGVNRGAAPSRNLGIRFARGDFIAPIDADDVWVPEKLAQQLSIFEAHPQLALVCGATRYWSSWAGGDDFVVQTGCVQDVIVFPPDATLSLYPIGYGASPCPSDLLLRRELVSSIGGFEENFVGPLQLYEDIAFLAKVFLAAPVYFSSQVWLNYRIHNDSCVMRVKRDGRYYQARRYFFSWFTRYLATGPTDPRVAFAVRRTIRRDVLRQAVASARTLLKRVPAAPAAARAARAISRRAKANIRLISPWSST